MKILRIMRPLNVFLLVQLLRALRLLLRLVPLSYRVRLLAAIPRQFTLFSNKTNQLIFTQARFAFAHDQRNSQYEVPKDLPQRIFSHLGQSVAEILSIQDLFRIADVEPSEHDPHIPNFVHVTSTGQHLVSKFRRQEKGALALSGHIGCFELLAAYYVRCGLKVSVMGRTPNYASLNKLLAEFRGSYGVDAIWRNRYNQTVSARKAVRALQSGHVLGVLLDQDTKLENGFSRFFGLKAASPIAPIKLAVKFGLPVATSFIVRIKPLHHHVITREIDYDPADKNAVQHILDVYTEHLEGVIREYPDQWLWWHRRWRRRPGINYREEPEKLRSTAEYLSWLEQMTALKQTGELKEDNL